MMMPEQQTLKILSAYVAENKLKMALEAEVRYMATKASVEEMAQEAVSKMVVEAIDEQVVSSNHNKTVCGTEIKDVITEVFDETSIGPGKDFEPEPPDEQNNHIQDQRLDAIYDEEPLGFEKDPLSDGAKMLAQYPLEEIDLGEGMIKRPTYINANISPELRVEVVQLLREYKDCFAWDYDEMLGLSRDLVELKLPIKPGRN